MTGEDARRIDWQAGLFFRVNDPARDGPGRFVLAPDRGHVVAMAFRGDGEECIVDCIRPATGGECALLGQTPIPDQVAKDAPLDPAFLSAGRAWAVGDPVGETAASRLMAALETIMEAAAEGDLQACMETARWTLHEERERLSERCGDEGL